MSAAPEEAGMSASSDVDAEAKKRDAKVATATTGIAVTDEIVISQPVWR